MADLPEPDWITLSESHSRAVQAFGAKASAVEEGLVKAFHHWKIRTHGRCRSYFDDDWLHELRKYIWDRAGVIWRANEFAIPSDRYGRHKIHVFSDVEVHRKDFKEWINGPADALHGSQKAKSSKARRRPGRKKGTGSYKKKDQILVEEMVQLIADDEDLPNFAAAKQVAQKAVGGGSEESKAKRLLGRYREQHN